MSAAAQRRTPLELVPDAAAPPEDNGWLTEPVQDQDLDWRATSVIDQWTPEHQLIGALMWLTAEQARPILELVPDTAIWRPMHPMGLRDHSRVVVDGRETPTRCWCCAAAGPAALRAWRLGRTIEPDADRGSNRMRRHRDLALHLASTPTPQDHHPAAAGDYARRSPRRGLPEKLRDTGIRMQQLAECGAERGDLTDQFAKIRDELADLWRRAETAAKPGWWRP